MGATPTLVGAVGPDFEEYRGWLEQHRVDTRSIRVSKTRHTARFLCTTDAAHNQIASFYGGAMADARSIELNAIVERIGRPALVVIAPNDPEAMLRHTDECRRQRYSFVADPSQQLARMSGDEVRRLLDGATLLFTNAYEASLLTQSTGWRPEEILDRVGIWVSTHGAGGVRIKRAGESEIAVNAVLAKDAVDPTGVGDAFRAGFLWGRTHRLSLERSAQAGCTLATIVLETSGAQEYRLDRAIFSDRVARAYGADAAGEIESRLRI
jgi:adenosine kinase